MILSSLVASLALATSVPSSAPASCRGELAPIAARFHQKAPKERYLALVRACGTERTVELTRALVAFQTVSAEKPAKASPQIAAMGRFLQGWAKAHGFTYQSFGKNDVFELTWGEGAPILGYLLHGDVVPAPPAEWKRPPFQAVVEHGRLYGRGVEDDKGPLAAVLTTLAMAKAVGLTPRGAVRVIVGNGEESDWTGMTAYAQSAVHPARVISVDANYPLVAAQSGFVAWGLSARVDAVVPTAAGEKPTLRAVDASGGDFLTQVPGEASLRLEPLGVPLERAHDTVLRVLAKLKADRPGLSARLREEKGALRLTVRGKAVHSSVADEGHDALWDLGAVALALPLEDNGISAMLRVIGRRFDGDLWGEKLGLAYRDPLMGRLLVVPTLLRVKDGVVSLGINMRRPQGRSAAAFGAALDAALKRIAQATQGRVTEAAAKGRYIGDPFVADTSGPLVKTLLSLYEREVPGKAAEPISVRGGTYARLFPGAVDFGPSLPGDAYAGHSPDESISLANLGLMANLLAEASWTFALAPVSP